MIYQIMLSFIRLHRTIAKKIRKQDDFDVLFISKEKTAQTGIVPYAATFEKKSELWTKTWEKGNWGKARFSTSATFEGAEIKFHTV